MPSAHRGFKAPKVKAPTFKAPKMPHVAAPARGSAVRAAKPRATNGQAQANRAAKAKTGTNHPATANPTRTMRSTPTTTAPFAYTYGQGTGSRRYRAYGYGRGYRNRYYGSRYGYGRSQGYNRAIVGRLRSVHRNLARIDHDYQGHRVKAMHAVAMAIRQLSHRSMVYRGVGFAQGMNNGLAVGMRRGVNGLNANLAGARRPQPQAQPQRMPQAQSDARMNQALRTLQGVHMQLSTQGSNTYGHARARGHVQHAIRELNTALAIR
jgi:hypothetical protein